MASDYDTTEFVDSDFSESRTPYGQMGEASASRAPTREEVDQKANEAQQKLSELKRAQSELERQRAELEDTRRRQSDFQTGRKEVLQDLERGVGLLAEAEFSARQEAEQLSKAVTGLRDALEKVEAIQEQDWSGEMFQTELTRALTTLENSRMEWNSCCLKFPILSGQNEELSSGSSEAGAGLTQLSVLQAARLGLALTWPIVLVGIAAIVLFAVLLN